MSKTRATQPVSRLHAAETHPCTPRRELSEREEATMQVWSYASQVNDVDAVNSHWFETDGGTVLIDAQRILPEAERALEHLRATTSAPVVAIVVTHAHTDHYGGLPVWRDAFPDAALYVHPMTYDVIMGDTRGFADARRRRHGRDFPAFQRIVTAMEGAIAVEEGSEITVGSARLRFVPMGASEAEQTTMVDVMGENVTFIGDLVNVGAPAVPFDSLANWLDQLDRIEAEFADRALYQGHGRAPLQDGDLADQRRFLLRLRDLTRDAATNGPIVPDARDAAVFALEREWPFYQGVAGDTRRQILAFAIDRVAKEMDIAIEGAGE